MGIAEVAEAVLGDKLIGLQVGNEPDLYAAYVLLVFFLCTQLTALVFSHGHRSSTYGPFDYFGDFGNVVNAVNKDNSIPVKNNLIAPNLAGTWTPE
jgi:hypothetical protein